MASHSNILAWKILWTEKPGGRQSTGSQRVGHDYVTNTSTFHFCFITFHLCGNSFLQSQRAWALSLTTGVVVRIRFSHHCNPTSISGQEPKSHFSALEILSNRNRKAINKGIPPGYYPLNNRVSKNLKGLVSQGAQG